MGHRRAGLVAQPTRKKPILHQPDAPPVPSKLDATPVPSHQLHVPRVPSSQSDNLIHIRLGATHKVVFLLGMAAGLVAARSGLVGVAINATAIAARGYEYNAEKDCIIVRQVTILSDKISYTVGFVNCFLRVPAVYLPCCPLPCSQGMLAELSEKSVHNLYVRGILSLGI